MFFTPIMQLLVFGYAVTTDINNITTAYYDLDKSYKAENLQEGSNHQDTSNQIYRIREGNTELVDR